MAKARAVTDEAEKGYQRTDPIIESPEYITVNRQLRYKGILKKVGDETTTLEVQKFLVAPAEVSLEVGAVVNLGDYETVRITVGMRMPCYREEVDEAFAYAKEFTTDKLVKERGEIVAWARDQRGAKNLF